MLLSLTLPYNYFSTFAGDLWFGRCKNKERNKIGRLGHLIDYLHLKVNSRLTYFFVGFNYNINNTIVIPVHKR